MKKKTAIVIGSGITGLSIAEILSRNNWKVVIIESQDKIGGEASLATQKWFHTGWLYASLPNPAAMLGCYYATQLYQKLYEPLFSKKVINIDISPNGVDYTDSNDGWFINERINYLFAISTYELSLIQKFYWPIYLRLFPFNRLKKLNYPIDSYSNYDDNLVEIMNKWENKSDGYKRYKVVQSTDSKIETNIVTNSLVSFLSADTEIITGAKIELIENGNNTQIKVGRIIHKPDCLIIASGKSIPTHLKMINLDKLASQIKSIKSPILVLKKKLSYPDFIRFTPKVSATINHIKFLIKDHSKISTIGSYYSFPVNQDPNISYFEELMCERMGITKEDILGSYYGIKTEYVGSEDRKYNHVVQKLNQNTFFALAGKFSQFPLLVNDFMKLNDLTAENKNTDDKIKIERNLIANTIPEKIVNDSKLD